MGWSIHILWVGLLMGSLSGTQAWAIAGDPKWQTYVFTILCFSQMGHVLVSAASILSCSAGHFPNLPLLGAVLLTFFLQMVILYIPP